MKTLEGPIEDRSFVVKLLRSQNIPNYHASVYENHHDTGYCGLVISLLYVDLRLDDEQLESKITDILNGAGFRER